MEPKEPTTCSTVRVTVEGGFAIVDTPDREDLAIRVNGVMRGPVPAVVLSEPTNFEIGFERGSLVMTHPASSGTTLSLRGPTNPGTQKT